MRKIASENLGDYLRKIRKSLGVKSASALADLMQEQYSSSGILRREEGELQIDTRYLELFCSALKIKGQEYEDLIWLAKAESLRQERNIKVLEDEYWKRRQEAKKIVTFSGALIPSVFQTLSYAQAIIEAEKRSKDPVRDAEIRTTAFRGWLNDENRRMRIVISELAFYNPVRSSAVMIEQLEKLLSVSTTESCLYRILPTDTFCNVPLYLIFSVFDERFCICESRVGAATSERNENVKVLLNDFETLWSHSFLGEKRELLIRKAIIHYKGLSNCSLG